MKGLIDEIYKKERSYISNIDNDNLLVCTHLSELEFYHKLKFNTLSSKTKQLEDTAATSDPQSAQGLSPTTKASKIIGVNISKRNERFSKTSTIPIKRKPTGKAKGRSSSLIEEKIDEKPMSAAGPAEDSPEVKQITLTTLDKHQTLMSEAKSEKR